MKKKWEQSGVGLFFILWVIAAQAQQIVTPGFGDDLRNISWQAWGWVVLFSMIGTMARMQGALKSKELELTVRDFIAWMSIGLFAAFIAFAVCEFLKEVTNRQVPDLIEGAIISLASYNRRAVIQWATERLRSIAKDAPITEAKKNDT